MSETQGFEALQSLSSNPDATPVREPVRDQFGRSYATGKRKNAIARVWIKPGKGTITINGRDQEIYFARPVLRMMIAQPLQVADRLGQFDVEVTVEGQTVKVKGPKGELSHTVAEPITVRKGDDGALAVERPNDERLSKSLHGLSRTLINNLVVGVTEGYEKKLEIHGTGYRVQARGSNLEFALGYSHSITVEPPAGITFVVENQTRFSVQGIDKQLVGEVAANIRKLRKPEPYKGKGVRYAGEHIRRKVGKAGK